MVDDAHSQRTAPALPCRQRQRRVCNEMRRALDVDPVIASGEVRIPDLRHASIQRKMMRELNGRFRLVSVSPTRAFELEAAVIRNVELEPLRSRAARRSK